MNVCGCECMYECVKSVVKVPPSVSRTKVQILETNCHEGSHYNTLGSEH